mgnify:FL=1|jgi:hypothetical protein
MKKTDFTIKIPKNVNYIGDIMTNLPANYLFNKGKPGCGGTTIALSNNENYIICVPFVSLVENKSVQYPESLGVLKDIGINNIKDYIRSTEIKKIIVTYDSLTKVVSALSQMGILRKFNLLVDEYHLLFTQYSFRSEAAQTVLNNYRKFKSFCFMTATPLEDEFMLDELVDIPVFEAVWEKENEIKVESVYCEKSTIPTISNLIQKHLSGEIEGNAHFFVNSVDYIKEIVRINKLNNSNTRAVWSKYNKMNPGVELGKPLDKAKKINFFTSTCFEGCDILDEDGRIYVISDGKKMHTFLDIGTSLQQIAGRIRNTKYWSHIYHFYTTTRYNVDCTYEEYKKMVEEEIKSDKRLMEGINSFDKKERDKVKIDDNIYLVKKDDKVVFDNNRVKIDLFNFKVAKCMYKVKANLAAEYDKVNINYIDTKSLVKNKFKMSNSFAEVVNEIITNKDEDYIKWAYSKYTFLEAAFEFLGYDKMSELEFKSSLIQRYLIKYSHISNDKKVRNLLKTYSEIYKGAFLSCKYIYHIFNNIYTELGISKSIKSTDILDFYTCRKSKKIINNKSENGYIIIK